MKLYMSDTGKQPVLLARNDIAIKQLKKLHKIVIGLNKLLQK